MSHKANGKTKFSFQLSTEQIIDLASAWNEQTWYPMQGYWKVIYSAAFAVCLLLNPWLCSVLIFVPDLGIKNLHSSLRHLGLITIVTSGKAKRRNTATGYRVKSLYFALACPCIYKILNLRSFQKTTSSFTMCEVRSTDLPGTLLFDYSKFVPQNLTGFCALITYTSFVAMAISMECTFFMKQMSFRLFFVWTNKNVIAS